MMAMQPNQSVIYVLILLGIGMVGEYWVYISINPEHALEAGNSRMLFLLKLVAGGGLWCRACFMVCYLAWVLSLPEVFSGTGKGRLSWKGKLPASVCIILCIFLLLKVQELPLVLFYFLYPVALLVFLLSGLGLPALIGWRNRQHFGIQNEKKKTETAQSFNFRTRDGYINVINPFRGIFISGAAGAGKSESLAYPIIRQAVKKGYTGIIYDFKFPVLAEQVHAALWESRRTDVAFYLLNFHDLTRSHRVNPVKADRMPVLAYAEEYSLAMLNNLLPETIRKKDFWIRSANALLAAVIWFLKKHHPEFCTIPHAVNIILYKDYLRTLGMLASDAETAGMVRSVISAVENDAEGQIAGVIGSLQLSIARINSPEICWVLSGDDFELDLNNPPSPKILAIGTDPSLVDAFSPLISCIITVALKQMNKPEKLPSLVLLDEAPTLYIPRLEMIPATARSNRIATVFMAQDYTQMVDSYGKEKADVIIANLNNQFYGRVGVASSARMICEIFGKEEKEMESRSTSQSQYGVRLSHNQSVSVNRQEKQVVRPQDLSSLKEGEFIGTTVEGKEPFFWSRIKAARTSASGQLIQPFAFDLQVQENFTKVRAEAEGVVNSYQPSLDKSGRKRRKK
jgi:hypothetical protein